jgi:hypothetical protein
LKQLIVTDLWDDPLSSRPVRAFFLGYQPWFVPPEVESKLRARASAILKLNRARTFCSPLSNAYHNKHLALIKTKQIENKDTKSSGQTRMVG